MIALTGPEYHDHAGRQVAAARRTINEHVTSAYTGICLACGRPGPCDELRAALETITRHGPAATEPTLPPAAAALGGAKDSLDDIRAACAAIVGAVDRAAAQLHGHGRAAHRLTHWQSALAETWAALADLYAGLHHARRLPDAPPANVGSVLTELGTARDDAEQARTLLATVRLRLTVAADRLTRTQIPAGRLAARRLGAAIVRLDLAAARLAVGTRVLDGYATGLATAASPSRLALPAPPRPPAGPVPEIAAGARTAGRLIAAAHRRRQPGLWGWSRQRQDREQPA